ANDYIIKKGDAIDTKAIVAKLGLPVFVKPSNSGSSFGVTKVKREEDLPAAVEEAYSEDGVVIIEEAIEGREMACGIYITSKAEHFLPVTEIISNNEFFDFEAKYNGASREVTPAEISEEVRAKLEKFTLMVYRVLRCYGLVRVDYIVRDGEPYFIEINTVPGMSGASIVPQQLMHAKITVNEM
ncbi:MAG: ATP-grasp domain-containing protein, partial [Rikenellaceae bacterium]